MCGRTFSFTLKTNKLRLEHALQFLFLFRASLVGSATLSMTYSIKVQPYNDPYIKIAEEAIGSISELLIPGAFFVDIIPILKYIPEWFPGAKLDRKSVV